MTSSMTSAAIYARVSSARQKKDETIASQTAALRAHAEQLGLDVPDDWVFEDEGHSGATLVRPALERLRDLVAGVGIDVVLCYSPDRLARKFAYQALLIEEFTRAGTRVEFIKGPRGDTPEDQLLVQFQGMFAEYEKAQILERYRRGKTHRAQTGSINVLSGAPFGYRYVAQERAHRRRLRDHRARGRAGRRAVPPLRRRRRLDRRAGPLADRLRRAHPHRQAPLGPQRGLGHAAQPRLRRARGVRQDHGRARVSRPEPGRPAAGPRHPTRVQDRRPARSPSGPRSRCRPSSARTPSPGSRSGWPTTSASPPATAATPRCCRAWPPARPAATATTAPPPAPPTRRSTTTGAWAATTTATKPAGSAPTSRSAPTTSTPWSGTTSPRCWPTPALIRAEIDKRLDTARSSDPAARERQRLENALAKASNGIARMIEAASPSCGPSARRARTSIRSTRDCAAASICKARSVAKAAGSFGSKARGAGLAGSAGYGAVGYGAPAGVTTRGVQPGGTGAGVGSGVE